MGEDLSEVVEESHIKGKVLGALNVTFMALFPKTNQPVSWDDFKPICVI